MGGSRQASPSIARIAWVLLCCDVKCNWQQGSDAVGQIDVAVIELEGLWDSTHE